MFSFKVVAPSVAKLNDTITISGTFTHNTNEYSDYFSISIQKPGEEVKTQNIRNYGNGSSTGGYTESTKITLDKPGKWKIGYGWVYYPADPNYPNGRLGYEDIVINVIDPNAKKPALEISPRLSTFKMNDNATFTISLKGAGPEHKIRNVTWTIEGKNYFVIKSSFSKTLEKLGISEVKAVATITNGLEEFKLEDITTVTVVNAEMKDVNIMINTNTPNIEFDETYKLNSTVTGVPKNSTINYEWIVNGKISGTESTFSETVTSLPMSRTVSLIASIVSPGYDGITVQSPEITIDVSPSTSWNPEVYITSVNREGYDTWQMGVNIGHGIHVENRDPISAVYFENLESKISQDGILISENDGLSARQPFPITKIGQNVQTILSGKSVGKIDGIIVYAPKNFEKIYNSTVKKLDFKDHQDEYQLKMFLDVNGEEHQLKKYSNSIINLEGKAGQKINVPIKFHFDYNYRIGSKEIGTLSTDVGRSNYEELFNSENSVIEVLDFKGDVVGKVVNNSVELTLPDEAREILGKIQVRTPIGKYTTSENILSADLKIRVYPNPLTPTPEIVMNFDPSPCVLESNYDAIISTSELPANSKIFAKFDEDTEYNEVDRKNYQAIALGGRLHSADVKITTDDYDDYIYTAQAAIEVVGKSWPDMSIKLNPSKTNLVVGENLIIDAELISSDIILNDPNSNFTVEWYKDNVSIPTEFVTRGYDLNWIVRQPGTHKFKCVISIHNIDYIDGYKLIENSIQITTEKRNMAITAKINPASPSIKFGQSQKLTAVVEGAEANATFEYTWKVDNAVTTPDAGSNGLSITVQGDAVKTKNVELSVLAKAEGTEDATATATTSVVIAKADQKAIVATLTVTPEEGKVGEEINAKIDVTDKEDGSTVSYKWETGETTQEITFVPDEAGSKLFKCEVTTKKANFTDAKVSRSKTIQIIAAPVVIDGDFYIHPLPHIDAAFMYGSWWALDEIQRLTEEGKDWKTETDMKYEKEINGFKKILQDYNIVMVQESRNGRIIDRVKLESGLIY